MQRYKHHNNAFKLTLKKKNKLCIFIKPYNNVLFEPIIWNYLHTLGNDWDLLIIDHLENENKINNLFCDWEYMYTDIDDIEYLPIILNKKYWNDLDYEYLFFINLDSIIINYNETFIDNALTYPFIGSNIINNTTDHSTCIIKKSILCNYLNKNITFNDIINKLKNNNENTNLFINTSKKIHDKQIILADMHINKFSYKKIKNLLKYSNV